MIICQACSKEEDRQSHAKWCKACAKVKDREAQYKSLKEARQRYSDYKIRMGCSRCGYNKCPASLDFHHKDPNLKERRVSVFINTALTQDEIEKCEVLCKNCHYEEHYNEKRGTGNDNRPKL